MDVIRPRDYYFWLFSCECGNKIVLNKTYVTKGLRKDCGCGFLESRYRLNKGEAAFNVLFNTYKTNAKRRSIPFKISKKKFRALTKNNCQYCGHSPATVFKRPKMNGNYVFNGIDRVDNTRGYVYSNICTCCETCNRAKLTMNKLAFLQWIKRVYLYNYGESHV